MAIIYSLETIGPALQTVTCNRGQRLVGHVVERNGQFEVRSWPADILIGTFSNLQRAVDAIIVANMRSELSELGLLMVRPQSYGTQTRYVVPENRNELSELLQELGVREGQPLEIPVPSEWLTDEDPV